MFETTRRRPHDSIVGFRIDLRTIFRTAPKDVICMKSWVVAAYYETVRDLSNEIVVYKCPDFCKPAVAVEIPHVSKTYEIDSEGHYCSEYPSAIPCSNEKLIVLRWKPSRHPESRLTTYDLSGPTARETAARAVNSECEFGYPCGGGACWSPEASAGVKIAICEMISVLSTRGH